MTMNGVFQTIWQRYLSRAVLLVLTLMAPVLCQAAWQLTWSDEFTQADGSSPDSTKWGFDVGGGGYGNNEPAGIFSVTATTGGCASAPRDDGGNRCSTCQSGRPVCGWKHNSELD